MDAKIPTVGLVVSTILSLVTISTLATCLMRRIETTKDWSRIPLTRWLTLAIYIDSILFIFTTGILQHGFGLNSSAGVCSAAILLCLACYMSTKVLIYYFLVEKVFIIRRAKTSRLKSKLYCFNCFGMLMPYCVVVVLNFVWRRAYFNDNGTCIIGMQSKAMMPLIIFDSVVNLYLTMLFVIPLRSLYSYKNTPNSTLRTIALRSFVGSLGTLTSSVANLTILMVLHGEAAWICLMCCNADILFSVLVLHWVTSKDSASGSSARRSNSAGQIASNRLERFGLSHKGQPTVTTHISAVRDMMGDDEDMEMRMGDWNKGDGSLTYPVDGIRVHVGQIVEIEGGKDLAEVDSEASMGDDDGKRRSQVSTEDLVQKPDTCVTRDRN